MAKMNGKDGHWYTDQNGNHYFVGEGESPKEGWEKTKRRKMIDGGKYKVDDGDGKGSREVSMEEYDRYEAEDADFDATTDDDFGFDTDDRPTPEQDLENEEIWDADYERSYGPYNFDAWDDVEMLKKAYEKAKGAGMEDSAQNALERIEELSGEFDNDDNEMFDVYGLSTEKGLKSAKDFLKRNGIDDPYSLNNKEFDDLAKKAQEEFGIENLELAQEFLVAPIDENKKGKPANNEEEPDGTNGWKPSDEATPAYDAGGFYSINEGDKWELDDGRSIEVRGVDGENVEVMTPNGMKRMTKDQLSDMVKNATKITADANKGKNDPQPAKKQTKPNKTDEQKKAAMKAKAKAKRDKEIQSMGKEIVEYYNGDPIDEDEVADILGGEYGYNQRMVNAIIKWVKENQ